jgi:predicted RNA methylase
LQCRRVDKRLLDYMQRRGAGQAFDRAHISAIDERRELQARRDGQAVDDHGAGAASADAAAVLGAGQLQVFAQDVDEQAVAARKVRCDRFAVERKFYLHVEIFSRSVAGL